MLAVAGLAQPPFEQNVASGETGIQIATSLYYSYPAGSNISLNYDVLNSTLHRLGPSNTNCDFFLADNTGTVLIAEPLMFRPDYNVWGFVVNSTYTNTLGLYSYYVYCNSTTEAGFVTKGFELTAYGDITSEDYTPMAVTILIPLFFALLCVIFAFSLSGEHTPLKIFLALLSFFGVMAALNYAIQIIGTFFTATELVDFISQDYVWLGWTIFIVIVYFILYWIIKIFNWMKGRKDNEVKFN